MLPLDQVEDLPGAEVFLELTDGQAIRFRILSAEQGKALISPRDGRPAHYVNTLRVHVPPDDKPTIPHYWDITSRKCITALLSYIDIGAHIGKVFTLRKEGHPPTCEYRLTVAPALGG